MARMQSENRVVYDCNLLHTIVTNRKGYCERDHGYGVSRGAYLVKLTCVIPQPMKHGTPSRLNESFDETDGLRNDDDCNQ